MFKNAKYGVQYVCRNGTTAYYCRYYDGMHWLMVNDPENDFIACYDDGHVFHVSDDVCKAYKWDPEEMKNFRLDIIRENM